MSVQSQSWLVIWQDDDTNNTEVTEWATKAQAEKHFDNYAIGLDQDAQLWLVKVVKKLEPNPKPDHKLIEYK